MDDQSGLKRVMKKTKHTAHNNKFVIVNERDKNIKEGFDETKRKNVCKIIHSKQAGFIPAFFCCCQLLRKPHHTQVIEMLTTLYLIDIYSQIYQQGLARKEPDIILFHF